jgi:hypothetical protein
LFDLTGLCVVDSHCHAFNPAKETEPFEKYFTLSGLSQRKTELVNTVLYRQVIAELRRILNVKGSHKHVVRERNRKYRSDPASYIQTLFQDAGIVSMLVDTGHPSEIFSDYTVPLHEFSALTNCKIYEIFRIENLVMSFLGKRLNFDVAIEEFNRVIDKKAREGIVSLKSIIAYISGLNIKKRSVEEVSRAHSELITLLDSGKNVLNIILSNSSNVKILFDFYLYQAAQSSSRHDIPLQIHVGLGNFPGIDLRKSNPLCLQEFLLLEEINDTKIVLTHGGYPYLEEAGFLANTLPNVYVDLSGTIPFVSIGVGQRLLNSFEMTPLNKLMFGSDCVEIPELAWISAIIAKKELTEIMNSFVEKWLLDKSWAIGTAKSIMGGNAKKIYKLTD